MEYGGVQLSTMMYTRVHYSGVWWRTVEHSSTMMYTRVNYSGVQWRTVEYDGAQCSTVEYTSVHSFCSDKGLTLETSANTLFTEFSISTSTLR